MCAHRHAGSEFCDSGCLDLADSEVNRRLGWGPSHCQGSEETMWRL